MSQVRVRIVDANSGHPIKSQTIAVVGNGKNLSENLKSDSTGVIQIQADRSWSLYVTTQPYAECRGKTNFARMEVAYPVQDIVDRGLSTLNTCGKATLQTRPGDLIVFEKRRSLISYLFGGLAY